MMKTNNVSLQQEINSGNIRVGLSPYFHNKENHAPLRWNKRDQEHSNKWAFGFSFAPTELSIQDFINHVLSGKAWTVSYFNSKSRIKKNFISSEFLALDIDNKDPDFNDPDNPEATRCIDNPVTFQQILSDPVVKAYALLVHPSPSSTPEWPKTRVIFRLSEPVFEANRWETLARGLIQHFSHFQPDKACKDVPRMFYGSDLPGAHINAENTLPLAVAGWLTASEALHDEQQQIAALIAPARIPLDRGSNRLEKYAAATYNNILNELANAGKGTRHDTIVSTAAKLFVYAKNDEPGFEKSRIERDLEAIYSHWPNVEASRDAVAWAWDNVEAKALEPADRTFTAPARPDKQPEKLHTFTEGDITGHTRYMNQMAIPQADDLILVGDTGIGKTRAVKEIIGSGDALGIVHRISLLNNLAGYLDMESSNSLTGPQLRQARRKVVTVDSVWKLAGNEVPAIPIIFIDEFEQVLDHLARSATLKDKRELTSATMCHLIKKAGRVIVADAYISQIAIDFLTSIRGKRPVVVVNKYVRERGHLTRFAHQNAAIGKAFELTAEDTGTVVIATSSIKKARRIHKQAVELFGDLSVLAVHSESTSDPAVKAFLRNPVENINRYRLVIYSPTVGSGVDISGANIRAVVGIFLSNPLAATDAHQMLNRCRGKHDVYLYIQPGTGGLETDPDTLYEDGIQNALATGKMAHFDDYGIRVLSDDQKGLMRLYALKQAQHNASQNQIDSEFMRLAQGYTGKTYDESERPDITAALKAAWGELCEADKRLVLSSPVIDKETYEALAETSAITPEIRAGYIRGLIEGMTGREITEADYDRLAKSQQRSAVKLLADVLYTSNEDLKARDRLNASRSLQDRRHYARRVAVLRGVIHTVFGPAGLENGAEFERDDLRFLADTALGDTQDELRLLFNRRADASKDSIAELRWLLAKFGMRLISRQTGKGDNRRRVYRLDAESCQTMLELARLCHQARTAEREKVLKTGIEGNTALRVLSTPPGDRGQIPLAPVPVGHDSLRKWAEIEF